MSDNDVEQSELLESLRRATLGEYDVYSELGRGGMATVFLALDVSLNRPVAIKVMSPSALNHRSLVDKTVLKSGSYVLAKAAVGYRFPASKSLKSSQIKESDIDPYEVPDFLAHSHFTEYMYGFDEPLFC